MDGYFKYSEVYGEGNEVESWSRNNGDGWSPRCFKSLEYLSTTIGRLIEPFTRPLNEREKEIAPREATMSQLSRERERKRGAKRRAKSKITPVFLMVLIFLIFLIFLVFLIVIVATSEIRCSLAGSLRWLSALEFTSLWLGVGVLGRHYLSSALASIEIEISADIRYPRASRAPPPPPAAMRHTPSPEGTFAFARSSWSS